MFELDGGASFALTSRRLSAPGRRAPAPARPPMPNAPRSTRPSPHPAQGGNPAHARPPGATAALVLADGTTFWGTGLGATGVRVGEMCFNTALTGYQEILTDPSYAVQI